MRLGIVLKIAGKEILSTIRDTRAIVSNLLIPLLLVPVMMIGLPLLMGGLFEREQETLTAVGVVGAEHVPDELMAAFSANNLEIRTVANAEESVRAGEVDVAITVPSDLAATIASGGTAQLELASKHGSMKSELNASKVQQAIAAYQAQIVSQRLSAAGLDPSVLAPVTVVARDASSVAERSSGQLSWLIPFFIAIWTLTGGQMTAIDATAGEKERGTLEVLLVAPVRRIEVVVGKFIATMAFGLSAALMAILGIALGGFAMSALILPRMGDTASQLAGVMGGSMSLSATAFLSILVSSLLLAAFVSALLIGIAMFARSFKEAQSYVAPLSFLFVIPAVALQFKDLIGLSDSIFYVPLLNVLVLMDNVVRGVATSAQALTTWGVMLVCVVLLLRFALRNFNKEGVIFRS